MGQDLFKYLPSEIVLSILSRLPVRSAMSCKCVCKPWLDLLKTPEFVKFHLSKSVPGFAVFERKPQPKPYKIIEFVDECPNIVFNLSLPFHEVLYSSVNGLLFVEKHFLCNPITRDYMKLPSPPDPYSRVEIYGFGVSKMSGQYKVVRVFSERGTPMEFVECQVYTVGTRLWRVIASHGTLRYKENMVGAFLNGNLHWLACKGSSTLISCLDLESELFNTISAPPLGDIGKGKSLSVLGDCLCVCDNLEYSETFAYKINIWLMKEYGDEKSWTKEFVIHKDVLDSYLGCLFPIKVSKDGDILMKSGYHNLTLIYYSSKTQTMRLVDDVFGLECHSFTSITVFTPSFLSLKTFGMENVTSFY